ncbi:coiled-coil domain-containing protein 181 [Dunckerocampus dactyliophorus]|uniref:coiled-coil domain-containing protein 181 n=1 Tax=Dunckerocampus dactyliophorus TaxID=161453 RepID=UPI002404FB2E|nr:coiled-coil domain-containing protein 181 [Dunckerocampus dactyliophorus]XP_054644734.1 coiled-coil domain-containing protein 181 [Dunckerocampus dactyliophorus]XP_054644735.1 coiled-coil domain-containing protein 181 [Dunckerocampus dactyliophorus]
MMSEAVCTKTREEYEDDFEKDLDWLISEESRSEEQGPDYEDIEADIDKDLAEDEKHHRMKGKKKHHQVEERSNQTEDLEEDEDRWPSPMEPLEYDSDRDSPGKSSPLGVDAQTDEEKKYILEKIQQANRQLKDQDAPDLTRRRRLQFKETLVTLVVPPSQFGNCGQVDRGDVSKDAEMEVSGKLSELKLSPGEEALKEGRVLVEKDGRFHLVSLKEVENQVLLPPIAHNGKSPTCFSSPRPHDGSSSACHKADPLRVPRPPAPPGGRPSSACHSQTGGQRRGVRRRVQSATGTPSQATFKLSPQQKELLHKSQERKERLAREAEQRKLEEEEQKRQENELAFKAWLMRKREQLQQERRIHRAQEMERMTSKRESSEPEEAFRLWLQRKQEQQQREKQLVQMRRLEEDGSYLLRSREECEHAFKLWLTRKRAEKRAEQQAARERSRRFVVEERRARRMRDLLCPAGDARTFRFTDQLTCRF